jgi:ABC-type multidrug transport system ATPase subunit
MANNKPFVSPNGFCNIENVATSKGKTVLESMKLDFPEGSVTAILGPSGSGKTTLMSILTQSLPINLKAKATGKTDSKR